MTLSQKFQKSDFFGHCSFTQLFYDVEMLMKKPKIFMKVVQQFWYVKHVGLIFLKNPPEATLVKVFNVEKT